MKVEILSMYMKQYKGVSELSIDFAHRLSILGCNGSGKSTIADGHFWLWANVNYELKSNPSVFPLNVEEATPTVSEKISADGQIIKFTKKQTRKITELSDGTRKVSLSNTYEINDVPKSERDVQKYFADLGIGLTLFLPLSHPEVFTSQKAQDMRKVLFSMATDISDEDIAKSTDGCADVATLLDNYTVEEITAMQKATMRKINENYGKSGEIINAKIEGLELAKIDVNTAGLAEKKEDLEHRLCIVTADSDSSDVDRLRIKKNVMDQRIKVTDLKNQILTDNSNRKFDQLHTLNDARSRYENAKSAVATMERDVKDANDLAISAQNAFDSFKELFDKEKAKTFDVKEGICPTCGQKLPEDQIEQKKAEWEKEHEKALHNINVQAAIAKKDVKNYTTKRDGFKADLEGEKNILERAEKDYKDAQAEYDDYPDDQTVLDSSVEYQKACAELEVAEKALEDYKPTVDHSAEIADIKAKIAEIDKALNQESSNKHIDEQIAELRQEQENYEQQRADAEKILYELDLLSKAKNEQLANSVNSHFTLVKFKLFDTLKNGSFVDACVPMIGDKQLGTSMNKALETLAKLDIINGLQKFYDLELPVFIDNAESLDEASKNEIDSDTQIIFLSVSDAKGLIFIQ